MQILLRLRILLSILILPTALLSQRNNNSLFLKKQETLSERWELERKDHRGVFIITPYKPVYVTAGRWSNSPNTKPFSENPLYSAPDKINYNNYEAKFQFSLKTKAIQGMFRGHADLWVAYTQKAHWQIYNSELSRPFRELNYEPEIILNFPVRYSFLGFTGRMVGVTFVHQSNGMSLPSSRSWNRIVGFAAFERDLWQVTLRGWYRLPDEEDENPAIADYAGRGEVIVVRNIGLHQLSLIAASGLRPDHAGRGNVQLNWVFPIINNFRGQLQLSDGYAETLIDYNHRQTTIGVSVALIDW